MRARAVFVAICAGMVSLALHAGSLVTLASSEDQTLAGGPTQLAMVGNGFEDAVADTISSATDPEPIDPTEADPSAAAVAEPMVTPPVEAPNVGVEAASPVPSDSILSPPVTDTVDPTTAASQTVPNAALPAPIADTPNSSAAPAQSIAPTTATPAPLAAAAIAPRETVVGQSAPVAQTPTADTPRPQQRIPRPTRADPPAPTQPQGNAQETARVGQADGAVQGTATQTQRGDAGQAAADGRAIARYPQQVLRRLSRIRPPNTRFDGAALVGFTVTANGGLARLSIARSSGNAEFDRLALTYVQRAVPFPAPPTGAQRSFSVTVRGR